MVDEGCEESLHVIDFSNNGRDESHKLPQTAASGFLPEAGKFGFFAESSLVFFKTPIMTTLKKKKNIAECGAS